jgi:hypothetical protein
MTSKAPTDRTIQRLQEATRFARNINRLPLGRAQKITILETQALPTLTAVAQLAPPPNILRINARTHMINVAWGTGRQHRCVDAVLNNAMQCHRADPFFTIKCNSV